MMKIFSSDLTIYFSFLVNNEPKGDTRGVVVGDVHQSSILLGLEKTTQKIKPQFGLKVSRNIICLSLIFLSEVGEFLTWD